MRYSKYISLFILVSGCLLGVTHHLQAKEHVCDVSPKNSDARVEDPILGTPVGTTSVTFYTSFNCFYCAELHRETLPKLQEAYVHTGKIHVRFRDFPLDKVSLQAAEIARAQGTKGYHKLSQAFFARQKEWLENKNSLKVLKKIAIENGVSARQIAKALKSKALETQLLNRCVDALKIYKIDSAPTIIVGDVDPIIIRHAADFTEISKAIEEQRTKEAARKQIDKAS